MNRRTLLQASAAVAAAVMLEGCRKRDEVLIEQAINRSRTLPGEPVFRRSVCRECGAGCGVEVRIVDGLAKKLEGASDHPVNRGGLCALGHSALQEHYHPDRVLTPLSATSEGPVAASWEEALAQVGGGLAAAGQAGRLAVVVEGGSDLESLTGSWLATALGEGNLVIDLGNEEAVERLAERVVFGAEVDYDLSATDLVVTFGARAHELWRSPVQYGRQLAELRSGRSDWLAQQRLRGQHVHIEPRHSLTAANADTWLSCHAGTEAWIAAGLAEDLIASGELDAGAVEEYRALGVPALAADRFEQVCGVSRDKVRRVAQWLLEARSPLVLAGGAIARTRNGLLGTVAVLGLQKLLMHRTADTAPLRERTQHPLVSALSEVLGPGSDGAGGLAELESALASDALDAVIFVRRNALYESLRSREVSERVAQLDTSVALATLLDDTASVCRTVLPVQTALESRHLQESPHVAGQPTAAVTAPAVAARGEARAATDVLLALATAAGVEVPWEDSEKLVQAAVGRAIERGAIDAPSASRALRDLHAVGFVTDTSGGVTRRVPPPAESIDVPWTDLAPLAEAADGELALRVFESARFGASGRGATRSWNLELPEPLSTVQWESWVELSPNDAGTAHVETGDWVRLSNERAALEVPVVVLPTVRPGTLHAVLGPGSVSGGRYAENRGADVRTLLDAEAVVLGTTVAASDGSTVKLEKLAQAPEGRAKRIAIYGRGLRQSEQLPRGWGSASLHSEAGDH